MAEDGTTRDGVVMRWAQVRDIESIIHYHTACWYDSFASLVSAEVMAFIESRPHEAMVEGWHHRLDPESSPKTVVAAGADDVALGHVMVDGDELVHLFIDPGHHGRGLGRQLLEVGERLIRQGGHEQAELHTIVGNAPAIALYEKFGWTVTDETLDEELPNGAGYSEHVLRKELGQPGHVDANRETWDEDAANWVDRGRRSWAAEPHWGEMAIAEAEVLVLPELEGRDVVELGCGTGYVSAWCLERGAASAVGVDNSIGQLRSAQALQREFDRPFPLVRANAERLPLADNCCDVAINEYGAGLWCDPNVWIPEAARVLRPGGSLVFLAWSTLMSMTAPDFDHERTSTELLRPHRDLHRVGFPDTDGVQFALSHGDWIALLTNNGFRIDRLVELYAPPADAGGPDRYSYFDASWARQWPPEEIWCATLSNEAETTRFTEV